MKSTVPIAGQGLGEGKTYLGRNLQEYVKGHMKDFEKYREVRDQLVTAYHLRVDMYSQPLRKTNDLSTAIKVLIYASINKSDFSKTDIDALKNKAWEEKVFIDEFVVEIQRLLALQSGIPGLDHRPVLLHIDEIGHLDDKQIIDKFVGAGGTARQLFYEFWELLDSTIKLPNCFVYLSGKNSQLEVVGHKPSELPVGLVERLFLEPLTTRHVMEMLVKPLPSSEFGGKAMCHVVFSVDVQKLEDKKF